MINNATTTNVTTNSTPCPNLIKATDTEAVVCVGAGTWVGVTGKVQASRNGTDYFDWPFYDVHGVFQDAGTTITLSDSTAGFLARVGGLQGMAAVRFLATAYTSGSAPITVDSGNFTGASVPSVPGGGNGTFSSVTSSGGIKSTSASAGVGYATGAGAAVTQITSRTTGVTINAPTGAITLVSAAGSATPASFTVTNSAVAATDTVVVSQKSGTDLYEIFVTAVAAGSFKITSFTTGGTTTETPVFNFAILKGVAS